MRGRVHGAGRGPQLQEPLPGSGCANILRERIRRGAEHRDQPAGHQTRCQAVHRPGLYFRVPRVDLVTVGEAFEDLIFVGLPRLPKAGEEVKTSRLVSTVGGGAVITAVAGARLGLRTAVIRGLSLDAARLPRRKTIRVVNLRRAPRMHATSGFI